MAKSIEYGIRAKAGKTIEYGIRGKSKGAKEFGIKKPSSDFDRRKEIGHAPEVNPNP